MDAAYTLNVLEHIPDDVAALRDLRRCLKPGARLFVYVPAFRVLFSSMDVRVGHLRRYRRRDLCLRLRSAGFAVERARYADCLGFFAALLYRLCGNREGQLNRDALRMYDRLAFPLSRGLDQVVGHVLGKNIWVSAYRPAGIVGTLIECPSTLGRTHSCPFL
jgi:hypothetical protein